VTLRAAEAIRSADVIRHPPGVDVATLALARPGAVIGELKGSDEIVYLAKHDQAESIGIVARALGLNVLDIQYIFD